MARRLAPLLSGSPRVRCAIYTRKSTEEGLEQAFNSLDAQREACAGYIASQRAEGWTLLPTHYDEGGFSGGNMERPGLRQLMADVAAGKVDTIVIYKVDRLTRSLADSAKIVEVLDKAGASFVSITQSFNTTTSMGRLIFERYLALGSTGELAAELDRRGIRSKRRVLGDDRIIGDRPFSRGALCHLLRNRAYVGEVSHHGEHFPGEHAAIIPLDLFDRVEACMQTNRTNHRCASRAKMPSLLASMLYDSEGRRMRPSHATKGSRRYRYYVTASTTADKRTPASACKIPAGELDQLVRERLANWLGKPCSMLELAGPATSASSLPGLLSAAGTLASTIAQMPVSELRMLLLDLNTQVQVEHDQVLVGVSAPALMERLGEPAPADQEAHRCIIVAAAALTRRGQELRLAFAPDDRSAPAQVDTRLVGLIAKAHAAPNQLLDGQERSKAARGHLTRLARLASLAPDITSAILDGRQPVQLTDRALLRVPDLPLAWSEQRTLLGFD